MLKPEEIRVGRRNFMKAAVAVPAMGAYVYAAREAQPLQVACIGTGNEGRVLLENADPAVMRVMAIADIRPDHRALAEYGVKKRYNENVRVYSDYHQMLADGGFEAVIIATPLNTHGPISVDCLNAGFHVLCEKTMAYHAAECEEMIRTAERNNLILAVGHQRHANPLYLQAKAMVESGMLGDVYHIRSLWHRNNNWRNLPKWFNEPLEEIWGERPIDAVRKIKPDLTPQAFKELSIPDQFALYFEYLQTKDPGFDPSAWGYDTADDLGNWRMYAKYSHGLMSELGSHQIDVCNWIWGAEPETVCGAGGIYHYKDGRDVDDHVYAIFRYPQGRVFMFSSITTNDFDHYYDQIMGTEGTIYLTGESQAMLFKEGEEKAAALEMEKTSTGKPVMSASGSRADDMAGGAYGGEGVGSTVDPFAAYGAEIRMFAEAIRKRNPDLVACNGMYGYKASQAVLKAVEAQNTNTVQDCRISKVVA